MMRSIVSTWFPFSLLQQLLQLRRNSVSDFLGLRLATDISRADARLGDVAHGGLDGLGLVRAREGVLQQHGHRQDGCQGVDDALAGDIGGGSCGLLSASVLDFDSGRAVGKVGR